MQNEGFVVWFTGLPSSGKSTLAMGLRNELQRRQLRVELLDGDEVRQGLTRDLGFSKADRDENIRRIAFVAGLLARNGVVAITAAISPYREMRDHARRTIERFVEVFTKCPLDVCIRRDVKGLYRRALAGEVPNFTGISDPYEEPLAPEVIAETDRENPETGVKKILAKLEGLGHLPASGEVASVPIPSYLARQIESRSAGKGSRAISNYVVQLLQRNLEEEADDDLTFEVRARVEARLRALGYLE